MTRKDHEWQGDKNLEEDCHDLFEGTITEVACNMTKTWTGYLWKTCLSHHFKFLGLKSSDHSFTLLYLLIPYTHSLCANSRNNGWETRKLFSFYIYWLSSMIPEINYINETTLIYMQLSDMKTRLHLSSIIKYNKKMSI